MDMKISAFKAINKLWKAITEETHIGHADFEQDIHKNLSTLFQLGDYYYYVIDLINAKIIFVDAEVENILGYAPPVFTLDYYLKKVHPEDLPYLLNFEKTALQFFKDLPKNKLLKYKVRYDIRIEKKDGNYIRILHQAIAIQHDVNGVLLASLSVDKDITHLKTDGTPVLSFIGLEGEPSYVDIEVEHFYAKSKDILTKREKQILVLMIDGLITKEISILLKISNQTVETHRKNMIKKAKVKSSGELIAQAIRKGWL